MCPGLERLGLSLIYFRPSDIGNLDSFLCLGMIGRLHLMKFGVTSLGCSVVGEPRV